MGVCNCSMFCCTLLYIHSSIAIILMGKRKLIALLNLSSWCLVMLERLFLAMPRGCLQFVIVVFPNHSHLPFLKALPPLPFNCDLYSVYHVFTLKCLFRGLSRLSTNLSCHGRSNGMREKLSGPPILKHLIK